MSSITTAQPYEATVNHHGHPTGPVRLPLVDRQLFIDAFNHRYRSAGLSITGYAATDGPRSLFGEVISSNFDATGLDSR